jgi:hypothetical protein
MLLRRQRGVLAADDEDLDYSDYEERAHNQVTYVSGEIGERAGDRGGWSPAFLTKHLSKQGHRDVHSKFGIWNVRQNVRRTCTAANSAPR